MYGEINIPDISNYNISFINNTLVLIPRIPLEIKQEYNLDNILNNDFKNSKIQECIINNTKKDIHHYRTVLLYIYGISDKKIIITNSKCNIRTDKINTHGFKWYEKIGLSIQGCDANKTILETVNMCKLQQIKLVLDVLLSNNVLVKIIVN